MPKPTNNKPLDIKSLQEPKPNLYAENTKPGRFHMEVPMLQKTEDGRQLHLPMVVLNTREQNEIEVAAYNLTKAAFKEAPKNDEPGAAAWARFMDDQRALLTILQCVRLPDDLTKKYFLDKQQIEDTYTPEEVGILCNHYLTVRLNQPHMKHFNQEDPEALQAIIDAIKKDGEKSDFFLNGFTTHSVNQLVKFLALRLQNSPKDNGLPGTP